MKDELLTKIKNFNSKTSSENEFSEIVSLAIKNGVSAKDMAEKFDGIETVVYRWSKGLAKPLPLFQMQIVNYIKNKLEKN